MDAGGTAVDWARKNGGLIPINIADSGISDGYAGRVYMTNNPKKAPDDVLKYIKKGRRVLRFLKKVFDILKQPPLPIPIP